ncbi:MAG: hypothetical protein J2P21_16580 [Chloracidobacterium sp.]|nr:hypothetical protein [Chloracidobacterium sp.]
MSALTSIQRMRRPICDAPAPQISQGMSQANKPQKIIVQANSVTPGIERFHTFLGGALGNAGKIWLSLHTASVTGSFIIPYRRIHS